jgi:predicted transcriptional regulator
MVTDRDACMAAYIQGRTLSAIQVRSAMAPEVISCLPTDDLETVEATMKANQIRRLPVIDWDGSLVGLIALNDIARESARELAVNGAEVTAQGLAETLAGICAPRQMGQRTLAAE